MDQTRVTGYLIGMFLSKSNFSKDRAVSLCGFSLGGVCSFYCMKVLKRLADFGDVKSIRLLNDVMLWAAAYCIDVTKKYEETLQKSQHCLVVNGNLNHLYSHKDYVLRGMFPFVFKNRKAIGTYAIFENIKE